MDSSLVPLRNLAAILVVFATGFVLVFTAPVTLPLALALFLLALHWPIQRRLERWLPRGVALTGTLGVFVAVATAFFWVLAESADEVREHSAGYAEKLQAAWEGVKGWLEGLGLGGYVGSSGGREGVGASAVEWGVRQLGRPALDTATGAVLVVAFLGLALLEVRPFRAKIELATRGEKSRWPRTIHRLAHELQRYILVRTGIGAITGVAVALGSAALGLRFWYIWGLLNFLLNYIPTLGSIAGVVPPVLFAWIQFQSWGMVLATFGIVGGVQLVMGNWIDPLVQGKYLQLSPLVVLLSVTFWGLVWGIVGALIAVPLTLAVVVVCNEYDATRFVATLLREAPRPDGGARAETADRRAMSSEAE